MVYSICVSLSDLFHLAQNSPSLSMLLQKAKFHSVLWLGIFLCVCVCVCINIFRAPLFWSFHLSPSGDTQSFGQTRGPLRVGFTRLCSSVPQKGEG